MVTSKLLVVLCVFLTFSSTGLVCGSSYVTQDDTFVFLEVVSEDDWSVDFGDGNMLDGDRGLAFFYHNYSDPGEYNVRVTTSTGGGEYRVFIDPLISVKATSLPGVIEVRVTNRGDVRELRVVVDDTEVSSSFIAYPGETVMFVDTSFIDILSNEEVDVVVRVLGEHFTVEDVVRLDGECPDLDGDKFRDIRCGFSDCDDSLSFVFPGAIEVCGNGVDEDCDGKDMLCVNISVNQGRNELHSLDCVCEPWGECVDGVRSRGCTGCEETVIVEDCSGEDCSGEDFVDEINQSGNTMKTSSEGEVTLNVTNSIVNVPSNNIRSNVTGESEVTRLTGETVRDGFHGGLNYFALFFLIALLPGLVLVIRTTTLKKKRSLDIKATLLPGEQKIVDYLIKKKGFGTQAEARHATGIPLTSLHRYIARLEVNNIISVERQGKMKKIHLSEWFLGKS